MSNQDQERTFPFTETRLKALPLPAPGGRVHYYDSKAPGLEVVVMSSGGMTFYTHFWSKALKRAPRVVIGRFPAIDIGDARKINRENVKSISEGKDPNEAKARARGELTLAELWAKLLEGYYKVRRAQTTVADYQRTFNNHLALWGNKRLSEASAADVEKLHARIAAEHGKAAANNALRLLRAIFNRASKHGFEGKNPTKGVDLFPSKSRERVIEGDELPKFFDALDKEQDADARDYILLALYSGARRNNVLMMRWEDVLPLERAEWRIPLTKSQEPQVVPLVPEAVAVLRGRERMKGASEYVFPRRGAASREFRGEYWEGKQTPSVKPHMAFPRKAWKRVLKAAGIKDLRGHDLRRSLGSWQVRTGASLSVVQKSLGHKSLSSTGIYARLDQAPVKTSTERAVTEMLKLAGRKTAEIVDITEAAKARKGRRDE